MRRPDPLCGLVRDLFAFPLAAIGQHGLEDVVGRGPVVGIVGEASIYSVLRGRGFDGKGPFIGAFRAGFELLRCGPLRRGQVASFVVGVMAATRWVRASDAERALVADGRHPGGSIAHVAGLRRRTDRRFWVRAHAWSASIVSLVMDGARDVATYYRDVWVLGKSLISLENPVTGQLLSGTTGSAGVVECSSVQSNGLGVAA